MNFNTIPVDLRTPGVFVEFDASRANRGLATLPHKVLFIGQKLAGGVAAALSLVRIRTVDDALTQFGRGSMLHRMFMRAKAIDPLSETWGIALADDAGGVAATKTLTFGGTATAAGALALLIAGQRVSVAVPSGTTAAALATAVNAALGAAVDLPYTSAVNAAVVTLTARHKGAAGNDIDVRANYYEGETLPTGITLAVAAGTAGATNPDITAVFTAIGDAPFTAYILPYSDSANLTAMETALTTRWGYASANDGIAYSAADGTYSGLSTLGGARNSPYVCIAGLKKCPNPPWELAAAFGAQVGYQGSVDPARPMQGLPLLGILAPAIVDRFTLPERDLLLRDGISTFTVDSGGVVLIERPITTYQTNPAGLADTAFLDVNTPLTLSYLRYTLRARFASKYPRHKLADDGTNIAPGQPIVTPRLIRAEMVALAQDWERSGLVESLEQFKADLVVERDASDRNRVNAVVPPDIINGLRVIAAQIQFLL